MSFGGKGGGRREQVTTTTSDLPEYSKPYVTRGLERAEDLYNLGFGPRISTYVAPSRQTMGALSGMEQMAAQASPLFQAQQDVVRQNLMGQNPLFGQALQGIVEQAMEPARRSGRTGSGYAQRAIAEAVAPQMLASQQAAISQVPSVFQASLSPFQTLAQVGAGREALEQQLIAEDIAEQQYEREMERGLLGDYISQIQGLPLGSVSTQSTPYYAPNPFGQALGFGFNVASMLGQTDPTTSILGRMIYGSQ